MQENQKETKKKMSYLEWYEQDRERRRQIKRSPSFYYGCLLPVFLIASLLFSFIRMGPEALMYSDDVYYDIKAVMDQAIKKGEGIDSKILQEGIDVEEEKDGVKTAEQAVHDILWKFLAPMVNGNIYEARPMNETGYPFADFGGSYINYQGTKLGNLLKVSISL